MKLETLLHGIAEIPPHLRTVEVTGIQDDSRRVIPGDLFVARAGKGDERERYAAEALRAGAVAILSDREGERTVAVSDSAKVMREAADRFWMLPDRNIRLWGVTGTNGKTTLTYLMEAALAAGGRKCGVLGTVSNRIGGESTPSQLTTPGLLDLYTFVDRVRNADAADVVLEVSSHALDQGRLGDLPISAAAFTNLSQDHLDYHGDMESYFAAKQKLFDRSLASDGIAVVNIDNPYGARLANRLNNQVWKVSAVDPSADLFAAADLSTGMSTVLKIATPYGEIETVSPLIGSFNRENLLVAAGWALAAGLSPDAVVNGFRQVRVPGRMEIAFDDAGSAVVDYAHTPDALERVLQSLRPQTEGKLIAVFGCGGDRDRGKRPLMGRAAARWADAVVVTSDNPRTENPKEIIRQIEAGIPAGTDYRVEPDRKEAIASAVRALRPGDVLLIAGKGHEKEQIIGTERFPFDDVETARRAREEVRRG